MHSTHSPIQPNPLEDKSYLDLEGETFKSNINKQVDHMSIHACIMTESAHKHGYVNLMILQGLQGLQQYFWQQKSVG
jgi:hypothetical protein